MKNLCSILFLLCFSFQLFSQETINGTITHDGMEREYILYVPEIYSGDISVPLVFNFHGYSSNAEQQMFYGDFRPIADTANFILVHPQGTLLNGITHWNVGGWTIGSAVDDVGFTSALIDSIAAEYNINLERVYSTGMSNGGFMSFLLACQLSEKIAAIASVTGSMTPETFNDCDPQHPTPVLQIHGDSDGVVPYDGAVWTKPVEEAIEYWVNYNDCELNAEITTLPDIVTIDGSTAEHIVHGNLGTYANTEHFKIYGGDHTWPGSGIVFTGTNYDMDASLEIWKFFSRYDINGIIELPTSVAEIKPETISVFPNPVSHVLYVDNDFSFSEKYELISVFGQTMKMGEIYLGRSEIDMSDMEAGLYFLKINDETFKVIKQN